MSTNLIDEMTESEAKEILSEICSRLLIDGKARTKSTILNGLNTERKYLKTLRELS